MLWGLYQNGREFWLTHQSFAGLATAGPGDSGVGALTPLSDALHIGDKLMIRSLDYRPRPLPRGWGRPGTVSKCPTDWVAFTVPESALVTILRMPCLAIPCSSSPLSLPSLAWGNRDCRWFVRHETSLCAVKRGCLQCLPEFLSLY